MTAEARRVPLQKRSRERVQRILEAAATLFVELGYEATTMEAIAERAKTSIGSVYQFFPNKRAIFDAMGEAYFARARDVFEELKRAEAEDTKNTSWEVFLDRAVDAFAEFELSNIMMRAVWLNWQVVPEFVTVGVELNREFARRTEASLAKHAKGLPASKRPLVATMIVEHLSAMIIVALRRDAEGTKELFEETKVLLKRYLRPYTRPKK